MMATMSFFGTCLPKGVVVVVEPSGVAEELWPPVLP